MLQNSQITMSMLEKAFDQQFDSKGWSKKNYSQDIVDLSQIFSENFEILKKQYLKENGLTSLEYNIEKFVELESLKSALRGALRYDIRFVETSLRLLKGQAALYEQQIDKDKIVFATGSFQNNFYYTLPYFMVHLFKDIAEEGTLHIDQHSYFNAYLTHWIPLTHYSSKSLVVISKSNQWHRYVRGAVTKLYNYKPQVSDLIFRTFFKRDIGLGNVYFWNGKVLHKGLRNNFQDVQAALVLKIMDKPLIYEPCFTFEDIHHFKTSKIQPVSIIELYRLLVETAKKVDKLRDIQNIYELSQHIQEMISEITYSSETARLFLSFTLGMLGQRAIFQKRPYIHFDLAALEIGTDNFVALERLLLSGHFDPKDPNCLKWFDEFRSKNDCSQVSMIYEHIINKKEIATPNILNDKAMKLTTQLFKIVN